MEQGRHQSRSTAPHLEQKASKLSSNPCAFKGLQVPGTICLDHAKLMWECYSRPRRRFKLEDPRVKLRACQQH